jgi:hypothetical protein
MLLRNVVDIHLITRPYIPNIEAFNIQYSCCVLFYFLNGLTWTSR